jgi:uncharacterized SAM-dependent methyltransferase
MQFLPMQIDLSTIIQILTSVFTAFVGFMLKGVYSDFKLALSKLSDHEVRLAVLEEKVKNLEAES